MNLKKVLPLLFVLASLSASANYMLIQNVSKVGNNPTTKTIQIQFDISWQNSWRDSINYDAAWIFIKYKDASGLWQHAKLSLSGYQNGTGTANTVGVASDSVGAYMYRNALGNGAFSSTGVQLQWNYGKYGLTDVSAFEVRVFAVEMVYIPKGDFNVAKTFYRFNPASYTSSTAKQFSAPGKNFPVINTRLSPTISYDTTYSSASTSYLINFRVKGDAGIDSTNSGIINAPNYPTGYNAFYCYKYELSEQQYADFLNTLTSTQQTAIGIAGSNITLKNGQYFSSTPNLACGNSTVTRLMAYADWSGLRPMTALEFNKASYGPMQPIINSYYGSGGYVAWGSTNSWVNGTCCGNQLYMNLMGLQNVGLYGTSTTVREMSGASYYGVMDLSGNAIEPVVKPNYFSFNTSNGDGILSASGLANVANWNTKMVIYIDQIKPSCCSVLSYWSGFRYVRSAE